MTKSCCNVGGFDRNGGKSGCRMLPRSRRCISFCQFADESDIVTLIQRPAHSPRWSITRSCLETSSIHGGPGRFSPPPPPPAEGKVRVYWWCCCIWLHGTLASVWGSRGGRQDWWAEVGDVAERRDTCRTRASPAGRTLHHQFWVIYSCFYP